MSVIGRHPPLGRDALRGYILEEVLAFLIRNAGYRILSDASEDWRNLKQTGAGIAVKGKGGIHQADVLGELTWSPAFAFPLRLFVEAKFTKRVTKTVTIRNAVGTITDVNQRSLSRGSRPLLRQYHYAYALFSATGFIKPAERLAFAHQIVLVDLSGREYSALRDAISTAADDVNLLPKEPKLVVNLRYALRENLGSSPPDSVKPNLKADLVTRLQPLLLSAVTVTRQYRELFIGTVDGPYTLLLKADNPADFVEYAKSRPAHKVTIRWSPENERARIWVVRPVDQRNAYRLTFRVPTLLYNWIFELGKDSQERAWRAKRRIFSSITVYYRAFGGNELEQDNIFKLEFDEPATEEAMANETL